MSVFRVGSNKSSVNNFPSVRPTLDLDFANSKTLDPRITFTRASGGSYVGADGYIKFAGVNEARFDHDPSTGESLGFLVEESRTNLALRSNTFNTYWSPVSATCVFTQNVTGPDGVANGAWTIDDQSTASDGAGFEQLFSITPSASTNYCLSIFAKQGTATYFDFYAFFTGTSTKGTYFRYNFSTDTISVTSADGGGISPTIYGKVAYPNGWYRLYFVVNDANSGLNNTLQYRIYPASRNTGVTGTTLFYGAQLEEGSFPTSYIPTEASTRTRAADNASITGKNFRDFYNQDEGTVYSNVKYNARPISGIANRTNWALKGALALVWQLWWETTNTGALLNQIFPAYDARIFRSGAIISPGDQVKMASAFKTNNYAFSQAGGTAQTDSSVVLLNNYTVLELGAVNQSNTYLNGTISRLTYYPKRLTNAQLQALTK